MAQPDDAGLIGKWCLPLDRDTANRLIGLLDAHPEYVATFEAPFLVFRSDSKEDDR